MLLNERIIIKEPFGSRRNPSATGDGSSYHLVSLAKHGLILRKACEQRIKAEACNFGCYRIRSSQTFGVTIELIDVVQPFGDCWLFAINGFGRCQLP